MPVFEKQHKIALKIKFKGFKKIVLEYNTLSTNNYEYILFVQYYELPYL